jgi:hypothetical protein
LTICAALLIADAPHLHDFAEWLYQAQILKILIADPGQVPHFELVHYAVPNALATVMLATISSVLPAIWAGKAFLILMLLGWYVVILLFARRHIDVGLQGVTVSVLFGTAALANFFWYGFVGYQLGLLLFVGFLALPEKRSTPFVIVAFSIAIFFAHAIVFLVFGLLIIIRCLLGKHLARLLALAPATALSLWFLWGRQGSEYILPVAGAQWAGPSEALLYKFGYPAMLGPFRNFLWPDGHSLLEQQGWLYWLGFAANFGSTVLLGLLVMLALWARRKDLFSSRRSGSAEQALALAVVILGLLYLAAPYNFFGLINPGGRLLLPIIMLAIMLGKAQPAWLMRLIFWPVATFALLSCSTYLFLMIETRGVDISVTNSSGGATLPNHSTFEFNSALYSDTRFKYFNYRIFDFADRFDKITACDYRQLGFQTGLIVQKAADAN